MISSLEIYGKGHHRLLVVCKPLNGRLEGEVVQSGGAVRAVLKTADGRRRKGKVTYYGGGGELELDTLHLTYLDVVTVNEVSIQGRKVL